MPQEINKVLAVLKGINAELEMRKQLFEQGNRNLNVLSRIEKDAKELQDMISLAERMRACEPSCECELCP